MPGTSRIRRRHIVELWVEQHCVAPMVESEAAPRAIYQALSAAINGGTAARISRTTFCMRMAALLTIMLGGYRDMRAQSTQSPEYDAARATAMANWINPPISANAGKDVVGVLTRDADELHAAQTLYKTASPSVQGAVDGSMLNAAQAVKVYATNIVTAHHCEPTLLPATADAFTRAVSLLTDASVCLGGQPAETLGHKIANQGNVRALERQFTFGMKGHGDKDAAIAKATDPKLAGSLDFAVQQVVNNYSKNDLSAEMARERQSSGQQQQAAPAPVAPPKQASPAPPPAHPASTMVDLAPAAPGYPPMHASSPAQDGCWWTPFISQKFGLEAAISHCETNSWAAVAAETNTGITLANPGSSSPPEQVLTVETKPADQTLEAAIKQQFIMKLTVPAARLSCRAQCETRSDGLSTCKVIATGSYSKLKRFNRGDDSSEDPCPGLMTNDAITTYFLARPSESKTKFLLFSADDLGATLNDATIHFLAQP